MDFFVVPTVTFRVLYVWFAIEHGRRRILHFNVTDHPSSTWVVQQLRETFPFDTAPRHLIFDRDATFSAQVVSTVKSFGTEPTRTAPRSPWHNGVAQRWIGSFRREPLLAGKRTGQDAEFVHVPGEIGVGLKSLEPEARRQPRRHVLVCRDGRET